MVNAAAKDRISFENLDNLFRDKDACRERVIMELINEKGKLFLSNDLYFYGSETGELSVVQ